MWYFGTGWFKAGISLYILIERKSFEGGGWGDDTITLADDIVVVNQGDMWVETSANRT